MFNLSKLTADSLLQPQISWRSYMLPAGYAMSLNALVSQTVDLHWGNSSEHMHDIMSNLVPPRVLEGKSVLCFGPDLLPKKVRCCFIWRI